MPVVKSMVPRASRPSCMVLALALTVLTTVLSIVFSDITVPLMVTVAFCRR